MDLHFITHVGVEWGGVSHVWVGSVMAGVGSVIKWWVGWVIQGWGGSGNII